MVALESIHGSSRIKFFEASERRASHADYHSPEEGSGLSTNSCPEHQDFNPAGTPLGHNRGDEAGSVSELTENG